MKFLILFFILVISLSCNRSKHNDSVDRIVEPVITIEDTIKPTTNDSQRLSKLVQISILNIQKNDITPHDLVVFAKTLIGIPYKYASTNPSEGFDCSGFITFVFNHYHIEVPRSSVDFTNIGKQIEFENAKEGDLILFTGTMDSIRIVGHMGIVTENIDTLKFIHATSGRANGVTISNFTNHYKARFVKVNRVFDN